MASFLYRPINIQVPNDTITLSLKLHCPWNPIIPTFVNWHDCNTYFKCFIVVIDFFITFKRIVLQSLGNWVKFFRVYSINNSNYFPKIEVKILKRARVIGKKAFLFKSFINHQRVIISIRRRFSWHTASPGDHASSQLCSHLLLKAVFFQSRRSLVLGMNL